MQNGCRFDTTGYFDKEPTLDDAEPQWESIGYRRDRGKQPPAPLKPTPPLPDALVARSQSILGNHMDAKKHNDWNIEECESAPKCSDQTWPTLHNVTERRCKEFVQLGENKGCQHRLSGCTSELHEKTADVCQTYVLNLMNTDDSLIEAAQQLEAKSPNDRDTYHRIVVWDFAGVRMRALKHFLEKLPLVHELLLPDRDYCPFHLLTLMELMNRHLYNKCPGLRWLVFRDGTAETL